MLNEKNGPSTALVGKDARYILQQIGISVPEEIKVILIETERDHPFVVHELMMPVLPVVRVENVDEAIDLAVKVEHGHRHTAMMHSTNVEKTDQNGAADQTTIFVKNGPSYAGLGVGGERTCHLPLPGRPVKG